MLDINIDNIITILPTNKCNIVQLKVNGELIEICGRNEIKEIQIIYGVEK